jgi:catechol 2,3-dioxygenase-like lactoylglutathione lyase family enzyme
MLDHISVAVNNFKQSVDFYDATLPKIGYERLMTFDQDESQSAGYGKDGEPAFWIGDEGGPEIPGEVIGKAKGFHICFLAPDVQSIISWHKACLAAGGKDNGSPGPRPEYRPGYYGAFIVNPNGWRIEAVLHSYQA